MRDNTITLNRDDLKLFSEEHHLDRMLLERLPDTNHLECRKRTMAERIGRFLLDQGAITAEVIDDEALPWLSLRLSGVILTGPVAGAMIHGEPDAP